MTNTTTTTRPAVGTEVQFPAEHLPFDERRTLRGDLLVTRTVADPEDYRTSDQGEEYVLVASPQGWTSTHIRSGETHRLWWVRLEHVVLPDTADGDLAATLLEDTTDQAMDLAAEVERLTAANRDLEMSRDRWEANCHTARTALHDVERKFDAFREQVRDVAIRVASEESWCDTGLNAVLKELDLPRKSRPFEVQVRLTQVVTVTVDAEDEDDAREKAENENDTADLLDLASRYDWEVEVEDANEA